MIGDCLNFTLVVYCISTRFVIFWCHNSRSKLSVLISPRVWVILVIKIHLIKVIYKDLKKSYWNVTDAIRRPKCYKARIEKKPFFVDIFDEKPKLTIITPCYPNLFFLQHTLRKKQCELYHISRWPYWRSLVLLLYLGVGYYSQGWSLGLRIFPTSVRKSM